MCTIALLLDTVADAPIVVAANRDELYARPTRPPERSASGIVGGIDVLSGGTWLAVRADGRFAAVTNQRALSTPPPGLRSRGLAVRELVESDDPDAYVRAIDPARYASMNLVWGDGQHASIAYARQDGRLDIQALGPGIHVLCNDRLGAEGFPRGARLHAGLAAIAGQSFAQSQPVIERALGDHTRVAVAEVPPSHLPPELSRELTATCIHSELYGTRSSTIFAAARGRVLHYLHSDGAPCTTPFLDRSPLLG
ncbi:MAG: NRDE family protein [Deltaproteobacteria bacterium]|nr:NRDE family protein [Deltaproteobacteria bacterium]